MSWQGPQFFPSFGCADRTLSLVGSLARMSGLLTAATCIGSAFLKAPPARSSATSQKPRADEARGDLGARHVALPSRQGGRICSQACQNKSHKSTRNQWDTLLPRAKPLMTYLLSIHTKTACTACVLFLLYFDGGVVETCRSKLQHCQCWAV